MSVESQIVIQKLKGHIEQIISKYELALSENISLKEELEKHKTDLEEKNNKMAIKIFT